MDIRFLANINLNYPNVYKKLPHFFRICCTKVIYNQLFHKIKTKGLNSRNSFFLLPENPLFFNQYLNVLENKIDGDSLYLNALVINNRLINIYKDVFKKISNEKNWNLFYIKDQILRVLVSLNVLNYQFFSYFNILILNIKKSKKL